MIDFVRVFYKDKQSFESYVMSEERFQEVDCVLGYHTGEVKYPYRANVENVEVIITEKVGYVLGSLHKFFNSWRTGKEHNYNDFTYSNLIEVIDYLSLRIFDFENTPLTQLEVGLNLDLDFSPKTFLEKNVLFHNLKRINLDKNYNGGGKMLQYDYTQYYVKIYDKGKMYRQKKNILRFEIKLIRKKIIQNNGVFTISDLRNKEILKELFELLIEKFDEMLIIDDYKEKNIDEKDLLLLQKYTNSRFWMVELQNKSRTTKANHSRKLNALLVKYDLLNLKSSLKLQLIQKYNHFINN